MVGLVIIYLIMAMVTIFVATKYDDKDKAGETYIKMGLLWPIVWIAIILFLPVELAKSIKAKDGDETD